MKGELIYVKHPRETYARSGGLCFVYFDIAQDEYVKCLDVASIDTSNMHPAEEVEISSRADEHAIKAIIFAALCVEAAINDYAGLHLGDSYSEKHLQNLDVVSKWVVIPTLVCGKSIDKSGPAFGALKKLVKARNKLVHNKSREFSPSVPGFADRIDKIDAEFQDDFKNSLRVLYLMCMEMDFVVGQMNNPIRTLDKKFNVTLEIPMQVKPLFDECKKIVLNLYS